jgi:hypothetical protein
MPPAALNPSILAVFAELDALNRTILHLEDGIGTRDEIRALVRSALDRMDPTEDVPEAVTRTAMRHISGLPQEPLPTAKSLPEAVALAWAAWITTGVDPVTLTMLKARTGQGEGLGGMHALALRYWIEAMEAGRDAGPRLWKRALEVSSSFGVDSHSTLQWAYAATCWPEGAEAPIP